VLSKMTECIPQKTKFKLELNLVGRAGTDSVYDEGMGNLGNYYIGIVAKMPLYSSVEVERGLKWESDIRFKIGELIGTIAANVVIARKSLKEIGLYSALEKRAQNRIEVGVAYTQEQVDYLEKVIIAQSKKNAAIASIHTARMELIALCSPLYQDNINRFLNRAIADALN